jgi:hypothetical protein
MATIEKPTTHREELSVIVELADRKFTIISLLVTIGIPLVAYLAQSTAALFYVHVALGAFWFGLDFFFKFVVGPSLDKAGEEAAGAVNRFMIPKMVVVAEPLSIGVVGSGIGLAHLLGYWSNPPHWLYGALGLAVLMLLNGFGPLHVLTTKMISEMTAEQPDAKRIEALFGKVQVLGLLQSIFMLAILVMMVGMRGFLSV